MPHPVSPEHAKQFPFGTTLLSRNTTDNFNKWGNEGIGYRAVLPSICENGRCPYPPVISREQEAAAPIHVLIASFRDRLCGRTLHNLFSKAAHPERIFVRIIDQTSDAVDAKTGQLLPDDEGCWHRYCHVYSTPEQCAKYQHQVRVINYDAALSKGPTDARAKLSAMIEYDYLHPSAADFVAINATSDFCFQIDSHMDFSDRFDDGLVDMWYRTNNEYGVLSTYVADISQNNQPSIKTVPNLCMVEFTSTIRNWGTKECIGLITPKLTNAMWGAGLSFHKCHGEIAVPIDPYLDNVFDGEEGSRGIRFFTHGYDVYTPDMILVTHDYHTHQGNPIVHTWGSLAKKKPSLRATAKTFDDPAQLAFLKEINHERPKLAVFGTPRVNMLLGVGPNNYTADTAAAKDRDEVYKIQWGRYGLGKKRSLLPQVLEFTGINLFERRMVKNGCGNLQWVPYELGEKAVNFGLDDVVNRALAGDGTRRWHQSGGGGSSSNVVQQVTPVAPDPVRPVASLAISGLLLLLLAALRFTVFGVQRKGQRHVN
jgi:Glycosyltransferase (GlcNAc)